MSEHDRDRGRFVEIVAETYRDWLAANDLGRLEAQVDSDDGSVCWVEVEDIDFTPEQGEEHDRMLHDRLLAAGLLDLAPEHIRNATG